MDEPLAGIRVQIRIDEDGSSSPPLLPLGTVVRIITGADGEPYYLVRLDSPVRSRYVRTGGDWTLFNLAIALNFRGSSLEPITRSANDYVPVGIVNLFALPDSDDPLLDFSKGEYFASGRVRRAV